MSNILFIYYSRTGNTRKVMRSLAKELGAECVELRDGVKRGGFFGAIRCGMDAMRKTCPANKPFQTERPLSSYDLVVVGTPVWAGRCSSVVRQFLQEHGGELNRAAYLVTRGSEEKTDEVYEQMDRYVPKGHTAAVSLRLGSVGYSFWYEEFLRILREGQN